MQVFQVQLNRIFLSFQNPFSSSSFHFHRFSRLYVYENPLLFYSFWIFVAVVVVVCFFVCLFVFLNFAFYFIFAIYFIFFSIIFLFLNQFFKFVPLISAHTTLVSHIVQSAGSRCEFGNESSMQADPTANPGL